MTNNLPAPQTDPVAALAHQARAVTSYADPEVAIRRPLAEVVAATLDATGKSENTRRAYETAIALFVAHLDTERGHLANGATWRPFVQKEVGGALLHVATDTGKAGSSYVWSDAPAAVLRLVDAGLVDGWAANRRALGDTDNTITSRLAAARSFLAVALRDNILTQEQAANLGIKPYRTRQRRDQGVVGRRLTAPEVKALRAAVDTSTVKGKRDLAILDLGLYLALRISETAGLTMLAFQQDGGRWWLTVKGKGGKTRRLKVHDTLYKSLTTWRDAAGLVWHDDRPLFYSVNKADRVTRCPISPTDAARVVAHYGAVAELAPPKGKGRLGAHDLRRTCARNAYDNGATLLQVQRLLGHSDPKTTAAYIGLGEDEADTAIDYVRY